MRFEDVLPEHVYQRLERFGPWNDVVSLAKRLGVEVEVRKIPPDGWLLQMPEDGHDAPMWSGWVVPGQKIVCDPASPYADTLRPTGLAARLLHELAHAVCGMEESDVLGWEVYAARVLWKKDSATARAVVEYQISTVENRECNEDIWAELPAHIRAGRAPEDEPGFSRRARREAYRRLRLGLPPEKGPVPTRGEHGES